MKRYLFIYIVGCVLTFLPSVEIKAQDTEYKLMHKGNMEFHARNYDRAAVLYMRALKQNPNNSRATFNLADAYLAKGNPKAADSLYNRVTHIERNCQIRSMAWHNRGYICQTAALHDQQQQQQLLRQAIDYYKQALRLNPHDNDTRYNLALCQRQLKNDENKQNKNQQQDSRHNQENKKQSKKNDNEKQRQKQQEQQEQQKQQEQQQTEQYINLARQAEQRALQKIKAQQPRQKSLDKNW